MKAWLATSATRADAIGWSLGVCALYLILTTAVSVFTWLPFAGPVVRAHADLASPVLLLFFDAGRVGFGFVFAFGALVTILALVTEQPLWVRIAGPLVCGLLVFALEHRFNVEFTSCLTAMKAFDDR